MRIVFFLTSFALAVLAGCRGSSHCTSRDEEFAVRNARHILCEESLKDVWSEWIYASVDSLRVVFRADSVTMEDGVVAHNPIAEVTAAGPRVEKKTEACSESTSSIASMSESQGQKSHRSETRDKERDKWYETCFKRLGQGVFIAALLWLLFLYLRRRM